MSAAQKVEQVLLAHTFWACVFEGHHDDTVTVEEHAAHVAEQIVAALGEPTVPETLPEGLVVSEDGSLLNWRGVNYVRQEPMTSHLEYAIRTKRGHYYRYADTWTLADILADQKVTGEEGDVLVSRTVLTGEWQEADQ